MAALLRAPGLILARNGDVLSCREVTKDIAKIAIDDPSAFFLRFSLVLLFLVFCAGNPIRPTSRTGRHVNHAFPRDKGIHVNLVGLDGSPFELFPR